MTSWAVKIYLSLILFAALYQNSHALFIIATINILKTVMEDL